MGLDYTQQVHATGIIQQMVGNVTKLLSLYVCERRVPLKHSTSFMDRSQNILYSRLNLENLLM